MTRLFSDSLQNDAAQESGVDLRVHWALLAPPAARRVGGGRHLPPVSVAMKSHSRGEEQALRERQGMSSLLLGEGTQQACRQRAARAASPAADLAGAAVDAGRTPSPVASGAQPDRTSDYLDCSPQALLQAHPNRAKWWEQTAQESARLLWGMVRR